MSTSELTEPRPVRLAGGVELPDRMRVNVMSRPGVAAVEHRALPAVGRGNVLVRVGAVGVCGSDVHWFRHGRIGDLTVSAPLVLGHEASGTVVGVGDGVEESLLGLRVSVEPQVPCRRCRQCHSGRYNLCPDMRFLGTPPIDGAFAEYLAGPADFVYPVPDGVSDEAAALLEPLSVGVWANQKARVGAGARVLVTGGGPIGLVAAQVALAFGAGEVVVSDVSPQRLEAAESFGARAVDARGDLGSDYDAFLECSGAQAAISAGIRATGRAGAVVLVGMGPAEVTIPLSVVQQRELRVTGTFRYANTWPLALDLVSRGVVDLDRLVTSHHPLADAATPLDPTDPAQLKAVVHPAD